MTDATTHEISITRMLDAPADAVFRAWTDAERLAVWWGPEGFSVPRCESDARLGGAFTIVMRGPDGTDHSMEGTYPVFEPPSRLVVASRVLGPDGRQLLEAETTLTLVDHDGKTELTIAERATALVPEAAQMLGGMEVGMLQSLRRLDDELTGASARQIVLGRMIEAPRDRVFAAWIEREQLERWWGPDGFTTTTHEIDVRPGGTWRFTMHGPDGADYPNLIRYLEIDPPARLVYDHSGDDDEPPFRTTVDLDDVWGMTAITMRVVFASAEERDRVAVEVGAVEGGEQTLGRLAAYVTQA
jgi:uncharacterized protein YndB with AHSA1/START domain